MPCTVLLILTSTMLLFCIYPHHNTYIFSSFKVVILYVSEWRTKIPERRVLAVCSVNLHTQSDGYCFSNHDSGEATEFCHFIYDCWFHIWDFAPINRKRIMARCQKRTLFSLIFCIFVWMWEIVYMYCLISTIYVCFWVELLL